MTSYRKSKKRQQVKSERRILPLLLIPIFLAIMFISSIELLRPSLEQEEFNDLSAMVHAQESIEIENPAADETYRDDIQTEISDNVIPEVSDTVLETEQTMLPQYVPIYEKNPDLFGWIHIEGTSVDYPVMHSPDEPERYLQKGFNGEYSVSGVPFMAAECYGGCGNYILYGHNMKNGSMFHTIMSYENEDFWQEHPLIHFDTLYQSGAYKVFGAFYSKAYYVDDADVFRVYDYTDLRDEAVFYEFAEQAKAASLYDTGVEAQYGDEFITLITCAYHAANERFIVVAVRDTEK